MATAVAGFIARQPAEEAVIVFLSRPCNPQPPNIRLVGDRNGQRLAIQINLFPFNDAEANWVLDTRRGEWREPRRSWLHDVHIDSEHRLLARDA